MFRCILVLVVALSLGEARRGTPSTTPGRRDAHQKKDHRVDFTPDYINIVTPKQVDNTAPLIEAINTSNEKQDQIITGKKCNDDCTSDAECGTSCGICFAGKCVQKKTGLADCCERKQIGATIHDLVGHNETIPDNCKTGCLYTANHKTDDEYCFNERDELSSTCNLEVMDGFSPLQQHPARQWPSNFGYICSPPTRGGLYQCRTWWYFINNINDFRKFNLQCNPGTGTMNGFRLRCHRSRYYRGYICRYYYWCATTTKNSLTNRIQTSNTQFTPSSVSVSDFTSQNVLCGSQTSFILGLQMQSMTTLNQMWYNMLCGIISPEPQCKTYLTNQTPAPGYIFFYLTFQLVQCPASTIADNFPNLRQFQLYKTTNSIYYKYTCCQ